jgi:uncharacterized protein (DUF2267 family)
MSELSLSVIDKTVHKTRLWLDDVMASIETTDRTKAFRALKAVLHALRDQLQVDEAARFGAQMPLLIRGLFYEGWRPEASIGAPVTVEDFVGAMADEYGEYPRLELERVCRSVYRVIAAHISAGEMRSVLMGLPDDVRAFLTAERYRAPHAPLFASV